MTHFVIPEDSDENWKGSEVMRNFLEKYQEVQAEIESSRLQVEGTDASNPIVEDTEANDYGILDLELKTAKANLEEAVKDLHKLASNSLKYGNEKATYHIELAAATLKDLIVELDEGDK